MVARLFWCATSVCMLFPCYIGLHGMLYDAALMKLWRSSSDAILIESLMTLLLTVRRLSSCKS